MCGPRKERVPIGFCGVKRNLSDDVVYVQYLLATLPVGVCTNASILLCFVGSKKLYLELLVCRLRVARQECRSHVIV